MSNLYVPPVLESHEGAKGAAQLHTLILQPKKSALTGGLEKTLPEHLREHAAAKGEKGAKFSLHGAPSRVVYGIGGLREFTPQEAADFGEAAGCTLNSEKLFDVNVQFPLEMKDKEVALNFLKGMMLANFRFDEIKSKAEGVAKRAELRRITFSGGPSSMITKDDIKAITAIVRGIAFARSLIECPPGIATPEGICERFQKAIDPKTIQLEIWDEKRLRKEGMGLLLAVGQGAHVPPRFLIARTGRDIQKKPTLFFVGKGVTFDTGGINLKVIPYKDLLGMKGDMAGAAAVLGTAIALSEIKPGVPVTILTPLAMNSIGSRAVIPGDVIRSYSGKTVEIQNTDAEGRLILADAVHYAVKEKAALIVDVATLTGACAVALGEYHSGLFCNQDDLQEQLIEASINGGEPVWPMPLSPRYGDELKSTVADLSNMGKGRNGGASLGAKFIENFAGTTPWAHLDIAGSADLGATPNAGRQLMGAGRMVHTLVNLALMHGEKNRGSGGSAKRN